MRVFFGLPVPPDAVMKIAPWISVVETDLPGARLVHPANLHVTMSFIGEVDDDEAGHLSSVCREIASKAETISATLTGLGLLPNSSHPRLVYLGIRSGADALRALAEEVCIRAGIKDEHRFLAHVTLARGRQVSRESALRVCHRRLPSAHVIFRSLVLFQSVLQPDGASYRPLQKVGLGGDI